jgi:hypothetical protein
MALFLTSNILPIIIDHPLGWAANLRKIISGIAPGKNVSATAQCGKENNCGFTGISFTLRTIV